MYYGEEIGMTNNDPKRREDVKDPIGRLGWPKEKGRDGERTPMQWDSSANAGFSQAKPWLPVPASYKTHNVAMELKEQDSILNFYRRVLALRHQDPALRDGDYVALNETDPNVLSYLRRYKDETVLVVLNMSSTAQKVSFDLQAQGLTASTAATMVMTGRPNRESASLKSVSLEPFGVYIGKIEK
jgi:alpha-glucosidase